MHYHFRKSVPSRGVGYITLPTTQQAPVLIPNFSAFPPGNWRLFAVILEWCLFWNPPISPTFLWSSLYNNQNWCLFWGPFKLLVIFPGKDIRDLVLIRRSKHRCLLNGGGVVPVGQIIFSLSSLPFLLLWKGSDIHDLLAKNLTSQRECSICGLLKKFDWVIMIIIIGQWCISFLPVNKPRLHGHIIFLALQRLFRVSRLCSFEFNIETRHCHCEFFKGKSSDEGDDVFKEWLCFTITFQPQRGEGKSGRRILSQVDCNNTICVFLFKRPHPRGGVWQSQEISRGMGRWPDKGPRILWECKSSLIVSFVEPARRRPAKDHGPKLWWCAKGSSVPDQAWRTIVFNGWNETLRTANSGEDFFVQSPCY